MINNFFRKIRLALRNCFLMETLISKQVILAQLNHINLHSKESILDSENDVIISLTTYNKRIHDVYLTIESLGLQTKKAKKVILWLDKDEFDTSSLPASINKLVERGLTVKYCDNLRSYKKLIPTLDMYPDENIITVDDDIIYPSDLVDRFVIENRKRPDVVLCNRAHLAKFDSKFKLKNYSSWVHDVQTEKERFDVVPTGVGGVFYPRNCFDRSVLESQIFMRLCPRADDLWFKLMTAKNSIPSYVLPRNSEFQKEFIEIGKSKDIALTEYNLIEGGNDKQIKSIESEFEFSSLLRKQYGQ
ncbi:TPA: hypothetical protein ACVU4L_000630 [Vibrio parahaemolyticus]|uniref:hypothetical protein n=1 Tax=Vibrio parahaemolyticus TaxID=670 RepID=UPI001B81B4AC|nr:hypothetical protein [Vibrio parahaemolyticus]MCC3780843.1 glycosyl transferase [Vibrio parahaemolyticus]HBC3556802.1 hypothetical protein [Vibrio parahaemolyticus]